MTDEIKMQLSKIKFESVLMFKALASNQYDEWLTNEIHEYAAAGNRKLAPRRKVVEWIMNYGLWIIHGNLNSLQNRKIY